MKKIYVYAICKNEEKNINRWYESMKEADDIYVLDTGSTDNSVRLLKELGVKVFEKHYDEFRFDQARNNSLELLPNEESICVCTDIDEIFDKGWRNEVEKIWKENTKRLKYNMNFSFDQNGKPLSTYYISKIHTRNDYKWINACHEVLKYIGKDKEEIETTNTFCINHLPDKTKERNYLPMLEKAVLEDENNDRNMHYLGREYMYKKEYQKAIDTLIKHTKMKNTWNEEVGASMRFISRCYKEINRMDEAEMWLYKAIQVTPKTKEVFVELGILYYELNEYEKAIDFLEYAITLKDKSEKFINEEFAWNELSNDILSICYIKIGNKEKAIENAKEALNINPNNNRIKNNLKIYESVKQI